MKWSLKRTYCRTRAVAQWLSTFLACMRPWVRSTTPQKQTKHTFCFIQLFSKLWNVSTLNWREHPAKYYRVPHATFSSSLNISRSRPLSSCAICDLGTVHPCKGRGLVCHLMVLVSYTSWCFNKSWWKIKPPNNEETNFGFGCILFNRLLKLCLNIF